MAQFSLVQISMDACYAIPSACVQLYNSISYDSLEKSEWVRENYGLYSLLRRPVVSLERSKGLPDATGIWEILNGWARNKSPGSGGMPYESTALSQNCLATSSRMCITSSKMKELQVIRAGFVNVTAIGRQERGNYMQYQAHNLNAELKILVKI